MLTTNTGTPGKRQGRVVMAWTALDFGFRGAAVGLVLVICALLLRDRPVRALSRSNA
jgi:hypothetical protein